MYRPGMVVHAYKSSDGRMRRPTSAIHWVLGYSIGHKRPCLKYPKLGAWERGSADYEGFAVVSWNKSQKNLVWMVLCDTDIERKLLFQGQ